MITEIKPETTVKEICELIAYIGEQEKDNFVSIIMQDDMSFFIQNGKDKEIITGNDELKEYLTKIKTDYSKVKSENIDELLKVALSTSEGKEKLCNALKEALL